ncbi:hypothetical protein EON65_23360 [archaeon]|nr:MAG: hypothetical protein EON65_23360 [archaeon]
MNQCELGKPKRRLKDVNQPSTSTPQQLSSSLTESLSGKKAPHSALSCSLTKLDDFKENSANLFSSTTQSISDKSLSKKKPAVIKAATGSRKPPLGVK